MRMVDGKRRYGCWAGNPDGYPENPLRCVQEVSQEHSYIPAQCRRARGHGPEGEYCRQHARHHLSLSHLIRETQS